MYLRGFHSLFRILKINYCSVSMIPSKTLNIFNSLLNWSIELNLCLELTKIIRIIMQYHLGRRGYKYQKSQCTITNSLWIHESYKKIYLIPTTTSPSIYKMIISYLIHTTVSENISFIHSIPFSCIAIPVEIQKNKDVKKRIKNCKLDLREVRKSFSI